MPSTSASDRLRNPFADDDDDEEDDHRPDLGSGSGSGSDEDDGDIDNAERGSGGGSSWNRGSWWRGVVRTARRGSGKKDIEKETERFGDGRDDETDSDDAVADEEEDIEDEEFGDFAMPETAQAPAGVALVSFAVIPDEKGQRLPNGLVAPPSLPVPPGLGCTGNGLRRSFSLAGSIPETIPPAGA